MHQRRCNATSSTEKQSVDRHGMADLDNGARNISVGGADGCRTIESLRWDCLADARHGVRFELKRCGVERSGNRARVEQGRCVGRRDLSR